MTRFLGYDPGGDGNHGVAALDVQIDGTVATVATSCVQTAAHALTWLRDQQTAPAGIGVDTLTEWSLGSAGWRQADRWLQRQYPEAKNSIASPNSLFGSMSLSGMAVLLRLRATWPTIAVCETHPKILFLALAKRKYDWRAAKDFMNTWCAELIGRSVACQTEHEWDALLSAWACAQGAAGKWTRDLHAAVAEDETMVRPLGATRYYWP